MKRQFTKAPPSSKLRPVKSKSPPDPSAPFPVYQNLVDTMVRGDEDVVRHVCAVLAAWAYSDIDTLSEIMARMGLEDNVCRSIVVHNNAMLVSSTSYLVQSACGRVVLLAYRGTDPFDLATWAADADVNPALVPVPPGAGLHPSVHGGFYRNQRATWFDVAEGLQGAASKKSILVGLDHADPPVTAGPGDLLKDELTSPKPARKDLEAIYITGHSLGAAMAIIAAYKLGTEAEYAPILGTGRLKGVHCFAPPMVGNADFAKQWHAAPALRGKLSTYVYENDLVPHLPPVPGFVHFGRTFVSKKPDPGADPSQYEWAESTEVVKQAALSAIGEAALGLVGDLPTVHGVDRLLEVAVFLGTAREPLRKFADSFRARRYSLYDHAPTNYVACSQPTSKGITRTEFGNDF